MQRAFKYQLQLHYYFALINSCYVLLCFEQTWFANRRASDWRRGRICRSCRYFKSPLATEQLHRLHPNSRHCVLLTMPQYLQNFAIQTGETLARSTPPSITTELDNANNEQARSFLSSQALSFTQPLEYQPYRQQIQCSQAAISCQMQGQQLGGMMPHQLPYSSQMVHNFYLHANVK